MRADRIKAGTLVDISLDRSRNGTPIAAEVVEKFQDGQYVELRLRQEGKVRSCIVGMWAGEQLKDTAPAHNGIGLFDPEIKHAFLLPAIPLGGGESPAFFAF